MKKGWETPKDCFNLMKECSRNMPCDITGVTWESLEGSHGIQWPCPEGREEQNSEEQHRLYGDGQFFTPSKKAQCVLNTGRGTVGQWHTQSRTKEVRFAGDVYGTSPIWPAAVKEGIIAASNMAGVLLLSTCFRLKWSNCMLLARFS